MLQGCIIVQAKINNNLKFLLKQDKNPFSLQDYHMGQDSKQIIIAKYVSKFLIYGAKMLDKCVKSKKKKNCTLSFFSKLS